MSPDALGFSIAGLNGSPMSVSTGTRLSSTTSSSLTRCNRTRSTEADRASEEILCLRPPAGPNKWSAVTKYWIPA